METAEQHGVSQIQKVLRALMGFEGEIALLGTLIMDSVIGGNLNNDASYCFSAKGGYEYSGAQHMKTQTQIYVNDRIVMGIVFGIPFVGSCEFAKGRDVSKAVDQAAHRRCHHDPNLTQHIGLIDGQSRFSREITKRLSLKQ